MIKGSCHCGQIGWTFNGRPETATSCNCTVCRRYGALWAYGYLDEEISQSGKSLAYVRSDGGKIQFRFCQNCGCLTHYVAIAPDKEGRRFMAVNLRMASPDETADIPLRRFDGHDGWCDLSNAGRRMADLW